MAGDDDVIDPKVEQLPDVSNYVFRNSWKTVGVLTHSIALYIW